MSESYLHFTTWQDIPIGTVLETSWEKSNYWDIKLKGLQEYNFNFEKMYQTINTFPEPIKELMIGFMKQTEPLQIHGKYASELLKEYIFEEVRLEAFPLLPSRKKCMFVFDEKVDVEKFARSLNFKMSDYSLVRVETVQDKTKVH